MPISGRSIIIKMIRFSGGVFVYHIVLCDDEAATLEQLNAHLRAIAAQNHWSIKVQTCSSGSELLQLPLDQADLLILDIGMEGLSGMEAARILRKQGQDVCIIFLTSMVQYALDGYDVQAFAFLPKPVSYDRLAVKVCEALDEVSRRRGVILTLKNGMSTDYIPSREILYADVQDHSVRIVLPEESRVYYIRLQAIEQQLTSHGFFRCHKSFLVNFRHIRAIRQDELLMCNGDTVPVSRHRRQEFLNAFSKFMGRGMS